ncbi:hypothetical protein [Acidithiobacillus sp. AMEEHan]|uniref:hypothetical protein n=1 Tax=Acidithiobacillus sp. AMEEHan TaxID=2994951 RepID=UPI0027E3C081|nr:hypothetical protein [Acidithiobacillus sp. AMEEHan]
MRLFCLEKVGYANRYAVSSSKKELLLLDFQDETLEADLDRILECLPDPRRIWLLQTHRHPALSAARERLEYLLPDAESLGPGDDPTALTPWRFSGHLLNILPMGNDHWAFALANWLFLGAVRDARGRWCGDELGRKIVAQEGALRRRLWAFPASAEKVVDLAALRALRAA